LNAQAKDTKARAGVIPDAPFFFGSLALRMRLTEDPLR